MVKDRRWEAERHNLEQKVRTRETHIKQLLSERGVLEDAIRWVLNTSHYPACCREGEAEEALGALEAKLSNMLTCTSVTPA